MPFGEQRDTTYRHSRLVLPKFFAFNFVIYEQTLLQREWGLHPNRTRKKKSIGAALSAKYTTREHADRTVEALVRVPTIGEMIKPIDWGLAFVSNSKSANKVLVCNLCGEES